MSSELPESDRPWRLYIAVGLFAALFAAGLFFAGGRQEVAENKRSAGQDAEAQRQRECEDQLAGIMAAVDPKELGLSSRQSDRAFDLNLWKDDCGALLAAEQIAEDEALVRQLLSAEGADSVLQPKYTTRDVSHLRTTILMRQSAEHIIGGELDPLQQVVRVFNFVQRNVLDAGADPPTMTPYEVLLLGRGDARQRAWVVAELLRQVDLDAVIVRPATAASEANDLWLLGVLINREGSSQLYLFDAVIGLPIPAAAERTSRTPLITQPATLTEVRADDSLLRQLDLPDNPYRFRAEQLQSVHVELIGHSSLWSNRVAAIDFAIELRGATFYDGLGTNRLKPKSLHARLSDAGRSLGWTADDLAVWEFPEQELTAFGTSTARGADLLQNYQTVLDGPTIMEIKDPETGETLQWDHPLIEGRHLQMTGACRDAIKTYNLIRSGVGVFKVEAVNDRCQESAVYWTAGCQYEQGDFQSVVSMGVSGQYPPAFRTATQPIWADGMGRLVALGMAQLGAYPQAAQLLTRFPPAVPHGDAYLGSRWVRISQPPAEAAPAASEDQPISPAVKPDETAASPPGDAPPAADSPPPANLPAATPSDAAPPESN
jgi:hypothetical protein